MQVHVETYRGIERADLHFAGVLIVEANNGDGKTSLAQAIACALSGEPKPFAGMRQSDSGMLVRGGSASAKAQITLGDSVSRVDWPKTRASSEGDAPPRASKYAVGLSSIVDMTQADRALVLGDILHAAPQRADLDAALKEIADAKLLTSVWDLIIAHGWDAAHTNWKEHRAKTKGVWEDTTGVKNYGSAKAASFMPDGWTDDLLEYSIETLNQAVADAQQRVEAHVGDVAVSEDQRERWAAAAATIDECKAVVETRQAELDAVVEAGSAAVAKAQASLDKAAENGAEAKAELDALPRPPEMEQTTPCPHCGEPCVISGHSLAKRAQGISDDEAQAMRAAIKDAEEAVTRMRESYADIKTQVEAATASLADAEHARDSNQSEAHTALAFAEHARDSLAAAGDAVEPDLEALDAARNALADARARAAAFGVKQKADALHADVQRSELIIAALAPQGVRQRVLSAALGTFQKGLTKLCSIAQWPIVEISADDMSISYGGRPVLMLSAGENYRVRAVLAARMAVWDKSCALVLDNLGEQQQPALDRASITGLLAIAAFLDAQAHIPTLVTMTGDGQIECVAPNTTGYHIVNGRLEVIA